MAERPEDLNLPNAVISRIIKDALPDGVIIAKEAKIAISKAASVFVLYATSCANNFALKSKRKTLTANDVLEAMEDMEFEKFIEPLKASLEVYRSSQKDKKQNAVKKKQERDAEKADDNKEISNVSQNGDSDNDVEDCEVNSEDNDRNDEDSAPVDQS